MAQTFRVIPISGTVQESVETIDSGVTIWPDVTLVDNGRAATGTVANPLVTAAAPRGLTMQKPAALTLTTTSQTVTFSPAPVMAFTLMNNSAADIYVEINAVATAGSFPVPAGTAATFGFQATTLGLMASTGSVSLNGTTANGAVLLGGT